MAIKRLKLTEDHIALIRSLDFHSFALGERFRTSKLDNSIEDLIQCKEKVEELLTAYEKNEKIDYSNIKLAMEQEYVVKTALEATYNARAEMSQVISSRSKYAWGIDQWSPWGGSSVLADIARRIGKYDEVFPEGNVEVPDELYDYLYGLYDDIIGNLPDILNLAFQFLDKGGLTPGVYKCVNYQGVWEREE